MKWLNVNQNEHLMPSGLKLTYIELRLLEYSSDQHEEDHRLDLIHLKRICGL